MGVCYFRDTYRVVVILWYSLGTEKERESSHICEPEERAKFKCQFCLLQANVDTIHTVMCLK